MADMHEFELDPHGPRWFRRSYPYFCIVAMLFYSVSAFMDLRDSGASFHLISALLGIPLFGFQGWFWWRLNRYYPFLRIDDNSIEYRLIGAMDVETVPLDQIQRLSFAGGNAILRLPNEKEVRVPYTRRTFELTQEARSKLTSWAKAHEIEVVG